MMPNASQQRRRKVGAMHHHRSDDDDKVDDDAMVDDDYSLSRNHDVVANASFAASTAVAVASAAAAALVATPASIGPARRGHRDCYGYQRHRNRRRHDGDRVCDDDYDDNDDGDGDDHQHGREARDDGGSAKSRRLKWDRRSMERERRKRAYLVSSAALLSIALVLLVTAGDRESGRGIDGLSGWEEEEEKRGVGPPSRIRSPKDRPSWKRRAEAMRKAKLMGYGVANDGGGAGGAGGGQGADDTRDDDDHHHRRHPSTRSIPNGRYRWTDPRILPPVPNRDDGAGLLGGGKSARAARRLPEAMPLNDAGVGGFFRNRSDFRVHRPEHPPMDWEVEQDLAEERAKAKAKAKAAVAKADSEGNGGNGGEGSRKEGTDGDLGGGGGGDGGGDIESNQDNGDSERMGPKVDYTTYEYTHPDPHDMSYPPLDGSYPPMDTLGNLLKIWPQDDIDHPPRPYHEVLARFDYQNPIEMESALRYREAELPFKVYNVPELIRAGKKWTDEYVSANFDRKTRGGGGGWTRGAGGSMFQKLYSVISGTKKVSEEGRGGDDKGNGNGDDADANADKDVAAASRLPRSHGHCQESPDSFFAFFQPMLWDVRSMGPPPTLDSDMSFERWAKHARYADRVGIGPTERHYYWQSGVPKEERLCPRDEWTFVSLDLPSFSSPEPTFFGFEPSEQKGIQCRFGERGVTAATHYDAGRNMIAMITGAKRYILGPPKECPRLGIVTTKSHPTFRHSLLNFAHLNLLGNSGGNGDGDGDGENGEAQVDEDAKSMPPSEREWLEVARDSRAVETILKAGEVLYVPSHWFHYITSLQKSAQCNTRSGREKGGTAWFGGYEDVVKCVGEGA